MEYTSLKELYRILIPAFNVKKRLLSLDKNNHITNMDIWNYLTETKWKISHNLTISDIVNDIITVTTESINNYKGEKQ